MRGPHLYRERSERTLPVCLSLRFVYLHTMQKWVSERVLETRQTGLKGHPLFTHQAEKKQLPHIRSTEVAHRSQLDPDAF